MSRIIISFTAALACVVVALAAGAAGAQARPDDTPSRSAVEAALADRAAAMWRYYSPDDAASRENLRSRDAAAQIRARQDLRSPDTRDIADGRRYPPTPTVVTLQPLPAPEPAAAGGFDWSDAAIGAAGTCGLILLTTAGGVVLVRRRTHRDQPVAVS